MNHLPLTSIENAGMIHSIHDRYATDFPAPPNRCRTTALLCIVALHLGVFYWIGTGLMRMPGERGHAKERKEIEIKFAIVPARPERQVLKPRAVERPSRQSNRTVAKAPLVPARQADAVAPALSTAMPEPDSPVLDLDKVRQSAVASALAEMKSRAGPGDIGKEAGNPIGKAISQASRPKCDNDYKPSIAGIGLDGLMKIPHLIGSAVTDKGCKW